jgi:hypothetical protein
MYSCSSINGEMNPRAKRQIADVMVQIDFRKMYPDKAKAIQGMSIPSPCCESVETLLEFANEKIANKKVKMEQERKLRESMGAPFKFDRYGHYKY